MDSNEELDNITYDSCYDYSSGSEDTDLENHIQLSHSCAYCPTICVEVDKATSDQANTLRAWFDLNLAHGFEADHHQCGFFGRIVDSILRATARNPVSLSPRPAGDLVAVEEMGIMLTPKEHPHQYRAVLTLTRQDGSFWYPLLLATHGYTETRLSRHGPPVKDWDTLRGRLSRCVESDLQPQTFLPLRLLRFQGNNHVILDTPQHMPVRYAVLSYCWGEPQHCRTMASNIHTRSSTGIKINRLSRTIRDALAVTRELGLEYLWVDAMCIVQDDPTDRHQQIAAMPEVYSGAYATISASSSVGASRGFLEVGDSAYTLYELPCQYADARGSIAMSTSNPYKEVEPLNSRAWALQEHMLTRRILDFRSDGLVYHCSCPHSWHKHTEKPRNLTVRKGKETIPDYGRWHSMVEEYSRRALSRPEDKLLAISGLAKQVAPANSRYLAGLWESNLPKDLLWICLSPRPRPKSNRAPSWTWASVDGEVSHCLAKAPKSSTKAAALRLWGCKITPTSNMAPYGAVFRQASDGLSVSGLVKVAEWTKNRTRLEDKDTGVELDADTYPDTVEWDNSEETISVYVLNYWFITENISESEIDCLGFILVPKQKMDGGKGRRFVRLGVYKSKTPSMWFSNSEIASVIID